MSASDKNAAQVTQTADNVDLTLLANFVHQVVNPLNGVAGTLDNFADGTIDGESRRMQKLNVARAQIEQCITLMRNLAFLARGSGGVADDDRRTVVLPQVIIESAMFYQEDGRTKMIEISLVDRATQNRVTGHPELIKQVLMNLFDNCVKYGKKNSLVSVNQWIQQKTGMAVITIDSESMYPLLNDELESIFELGYRGSNAKKVVASGTGLGLHICKRLVENDLGGNISVQKTQGNGLKFMIKLPNGEPG